MMIDTDSIIFCIGLLVLCIGLLFHLSNKFKDRIESYHDREKLMMEFSYRKGYLDALNGSKPDFEKSYSDLQKIMKGKDK